MKKEHTLLTDELDSKLDIVEIISGYLPLKRKGPGYEGVCPFHQDDGTSLNIYPENQTWLCSGSCAVTRKLNRLAPANHGDATSFVARIEGISFGDAIRKLAVRCGLAPRNGAQQEQTDVPVLRQPRKAMAAAQKIPGMYSQATPTLPYFSELEDPHLQTGHLAYKGRLYEPRNFLANMGRRYELAVQPRLGLVIALHATLQGHCQIEYPDGERKILDSIGMHDAGDVIWTNNGEASAVIKDVITRKHSEVEVLGVSTRGFCLLELPGTNDLSWCWPREPLEAGGRGRPFYYQTGPNDADVEGVLLESFSVANSLLPEYLDISGVTVPVSEVKRNRRSHKDRLIQKSK